MGVSYRYTSVLYILAGLVIGLLISAASDLTTADSELPYTAQSPEIMSPSDTISEDQIHVYQNRVVIDIDAEWARLEDTNSMDPFFDKGANVLQVIPKSPDEIKVGDIISYETENGVIIHRVIAIEEDEYGLFYTVKGDNNPTADPVKVRFSDVRKKLVGVLY
jgi:signal peptidase